LFIKPCARILNFIKDRFKRKEKRLLNRGEDEKKPWSSRKHTAAKVIGARELREMDRYKQIRWCGQKLPLLSPRASHTPPKAWEAHG